MNLIIIVISKNYYATFLIKFCLFLIQLSLSRILLLYLMYFYYHNFCFICTIDFKHKRYFGLWLDLIPYLYEVIVLIFVSRLELSLLPAWHYFVGPATTMLSLETVASGGSPPLVALVLYLDGLQWCCKPLWLFIDAHFCW